MVESGPHVALLTSSASLKPHSFTNSCSAAKLGLNLFLSYSSKDSNSGVLKNEFKGVCVYVQHGVKVIALWCIIFLSMYTVKDNHSFNKLKKLKSL